MSMRTIVIAAAISLGASAAAVAQNRGGPAFTATGTMCSDVTWSADTLRRYPNIGNACREVMQRDGKYYVKFEGQVERVADRGRQLTIDFEEGDRLTLEPPENLSLSINGRPTAVRDLRPGDQLTFYVPQDQLTASFFAGQPETAPAQTVPIAPTPPAGGLVAQNQPPRGGALPRTASALPLAGVVGALLLALGASLTLRRRLRSTQRR